MSITHVKIHPAIGIARVGNSPEEFFVGPERLFDPPSPSGGFKDAAGRVKRQAARFRVFAYHDDGTTSELSAADADISWTVHLAEPPSGFVRESAPGRQDGRGVLYALLSGEAAGTAMTHWLLGDSAPATAYEQWLDVRFAEYCRTRRDHYALETRWRSSPFWSRRA